MMALQDSFASSMDRSACAAAQADLDPYWSQSRLVLFLILQLILIWQNVLKMNVYQPKLSLAKCVLVYNVHKIKMQVYENISGIKTDSKPKRIYASPDTIKNRS